MSAISLNYALRDTRGELSGNLGWLFTMYWLHCDQLLRCYPSNETLKQETGMNSDATLTKHRDMLIKMQALILVPYEKRITEKEKALHQRKYIYQITGVMQLSDRIIPTIYMNSPEAQETHLSILDDLGFDTKLFKQAHGIDDNAKPSKIESLNPQKLKVSKIEGEVVTLKEKVNTEEVTTSATTSQSIPTAQDNNNANEKLSAEDYEAYTAILRSDFKLGAGMVHDVYHQLRGSTAKDNRRHKYGAEFRNLPVGIQELKSFVAWYRSETDGLDLPTRADTLENWFSRYRTAQATQATRTDTRLQARKLPANIDMLKTEAGND